MAIWAVNLNSCKSEGICLDKARLKTILVVAQFPYDFLHNATTVYVISIVLLSKLPSQKGLNVLSSELDLPLPETNKQKDISSYIPHHPF